jgi:hypothetical protein
MKIVDIRTTPLCYRCEPPYDSAASTGATRQHHRHTNIVARTLDV